VRYHRGRHGPFKLVFAGGTCLARAHKLVYRMSEDVDFKVIPADDQPMSKTKRRKELGNLRDRATERLQAALATDSRYSRRYAEFLELMVYGDKPPYEDAMATVSSLVRQLEAV
jgi:predicted nucleotidyltransferase component of viral defense system